MQLIPDILDQELESYGIGLHRGLGVTGVEGALRSGLGNGATDGVTLARQLLPGAATV